jgi:hypothetical protein
MLWSVASIFLLLFSLKFWAAGLTGSIWIAKFGGIDGQKYARLMYLTCPEGAGD